MAKPTVAFFQSESDQLKIASRVAKLNDPYIKLLGNPTRLGVKVLQIIRAHDLQVKNDIKSKSIMVWAAMGDFTAKLIQVDGGVGSKSVKATLKGHSGPVTCVSTIYNEENEPTEMLLTGSWDKTIRLWNTKSGELFRVIQAHADSVESMIRIGGKVLSASLDGNILTWDIEGY
ncbi:putative WD repeat-containing protein [Smittium culicis]|uniref:Putative WD repeat-containing protein n=1 Tax=Smittium culicis TaxID=133412 RepID=A0A1R1YE59_9FUNG|nr:putative WD repeat-containing protein [Smittium culicis]